MKKINLMAVALALVACAPAALAQDPTAASNDIWRNFYLKLASIIRGADKDNQKMLVLNVPGVPLEQMEEPTEADRLQMNQMLDETLAYNPTCFEHGTKSFSRTYSQILSDAILDKGPELPAADKKRLTDALAVTNPKKSKLMAEYKEYREAYTEAMAQMDAEIFESFANSKGGRASQSTKNKVTDAKAAWEGHGHKREVDKALNTIRELSNKDPESYWTALNNDFEGSKLQGVPQVVTYPPMKLWAGDTGWVKFSFKIVEKTSSEKTTKRDSQVRASVKIGFYKASGNASKASEAMKALTSDKSLVIDLEFKKVLVSRPWMDWDVFSNTKWSWSKPMVSDGKGGGTMPLYTNAFIVVRNVKFKAKSIGTFKEDLKSEFHTSVKGGYGPFSVSASSNGEDTSNQDDSKEEKNAITIPDPQIIGYYCTIVPNCPAKVTTKTKK